jgi:hypothetical protein
MEHIEDVSGHPGCVEVTLSHSVHILDNKPDAADEHIARTAYDLPSRSDASRAGQREGFAFGQPAANAI